MLFELLKRVCEGLESLNIDYMISGSLALNAYTVPRMTRDIDIVVHLNTSQITEFLHLFQNGFYWSEPAIQEAVKKTAMFNLIDLDSGYKIDFIVLKPDAFRQEEFSRRIRSDVFGFPLWLVQLEDLILSKLIWIQMLESDRQLDDLRHLVACPNINFEYLHQWCTTLKLKTFGLFEDV